ncbi:MAG: 23S rRNA (guanosine(2251)-2'-O)-methyltransferase RlmB [bacterium]|uniref:23S rRNA (Guanosine(2251)-2'-O)-methyltransferase RlmB n=1 Tax=Candidatus Methylomirabilis tolerans TaxID=3123416 RepID=A0AAJ1EJ37_9BACT|nr:23S rRNA (guanosine(2251)-2'-O)-methyltransferase RlmB [Candidatus Methylomirabilis sp.]
MTEHVLVGPHAVLEALRARRRHIDRIYLARERYDPRIAEIVKRARDLGVPFKEEKRERLGELAKGVMHQGVLAVVSEVDYDDPFDLVARIRAATPLPLLLLLDGVQDPQNLGAIIRTAEAVGVDGLFISKHRAAGITPAVARASAGAVEHLPVARVAGLPTFLAWLKDQGVWIVGADPNAAQSLYEIDLHASMGVVIGGEHRGLTVLVRQRCDLLARIPTRGCVDSLNAAAAAAVFLFEIRRQHSVMKQLSANRQETSINTRKDS